MIEIELHGIEVFGRHGVNDEEREEGQTFLFDVTLEADEPAEDSIGATVDYRAVRDIVRATSDAGTHALIETLATAIADAILAALPVHTVRVRVRKPGISWAEWAAATAERP